MIWPNKYRLFRKTIASIVACVFLWQQVSFAADGIDYSLDKLNTEQTQSYAPEYLIHQQAMSASVIATKQAIEDSYGLQTQLDQPLSETPQDTSEDLLDLQGPKSSENAMEETAPMLAAQAQGAAPEAPGSTEDGPVLSVTTQTGDVIHYKDGKIVSIDTKDSSGGKVTIGGIDGLELVDADNNLINARITYSDGTVQILLNGIVSTITKQDGTLFEYSDIVTAPDGTTFTYNKGALITRATYPDADDPAGNIVDYFYTADNNGDILETKLTDTEKSSCYDKNGTLIRVVFDTGKIIEYDTDNTDDNDNGILSKVVTEDGSIYIYESTESIEGGETVYTVKLKEVKDTSSNIFRLEDNNITEIELSNGTTLRNFALDASGDLLSGEIIYKNDPTLLSVLVENKMITETNDLSGTKTKYHYEEFNASGEPIKATIQVDDNLGNVNIYTYIKDETTNSVTIISGDNTWEYDSAWTLVRFNNSCGTIENHFSPLPAVTPVYLGSTFTLNDDTIKEYNANKSLIKTTLADKTTYEYYQDGAFEGNIRREVSPDGLIKLYDYKITPEGDLAVYKRTAYDNNSSYKSFYSISSVNHTTNPTLKTSFSLDGARSYSYAYAGAYYYQYNDKSVSLSLNISNDQPYIYFNNYDYRTRQSTYDYKQLDMSIDQDIEYTLEYVWTETSVDIYLYKTLDARPATATYTIADNKWDPTFYAGGDNARLALDPSSSGAFKRSESVYSDYSNPLKGNPIYTAEFTFDGDSADRSIYYSIYGNDDNSYDSIYFNYYNEAANLYVYHQDYQNY